MKSSQFQRIETKTLPTQKKELGLSLNPTKNLTNQSQLYIDLQYVQISTLTLSNVTSEML